MFGMPATSDRSRFTQYFRVWREAARRRSRGTDHRLVRESSGSQSLTTSATGELGTTVTPTAVSCPRPVMFVSIVIPVRNEQDFIGCTLRALLQQEYPQEAFEILVVDGASTDETARIVQRYSRRDSRIRLLNNPKRWSSAARNIGALAARGDVIVIVDAHCQFENHLYLRHLVDAFERSGADCIGRPQPLDVTDGSLLQQAITVARSSWLGHHPDSYIYSNQERFVPAISVGAAYRQSVFDELGYFDESFDACEDVEFNHRLDKSGLKCLLTPHIRLRYYPRSSLQGLIRQMSRYGRGRVRLFQKHHDTYSLKCFLPAIFLLFLIVGGLAGICWRPWAPMYLGVVLLYAILVLGCSLVLAIRNRNAILLPLLPCVFAAIHFGAGWGSLYELLLGSDSPVRSNELGNAPVQAHTSTSFVRWPSQAVDDQHVARSTALEGHRTKDSHSRSAKPEASGGLCVCS